jgi:glutamate--cysteine ligase
VPAPARSLSLDDVHSHARSDCLRPGPDGRIGVELELLTWRPGDPDRHLDGDGLRAAVDGLDLPARSRVTLEPGGQVEVSTPPCRGLRAATDAGARDLATLRSALATAGVATTARGIDPWRPARRVLDHPRYVAMQAYFDAQGTAGRRMMCSTASVQVNLDLGRAADVRPRWTLAHAAGPVLIAAFANSPLPRRRVRSARQEVWAAIDSTRTGPALGCGHPADEWVRYALDAQVMLVRVSDDHYEPVHESLPFGRWLAAGHPLGWPTLDDFTYHLTTLFPPVRPRGWFEFRMIDALPEPWWRVPVAVATALLYDPAAADVAGRAVGPVAACWVEAARHGLSHPGLAAAARTVFAAVLDALGRLDAGPETVAAVEAYVARYVDRGRCPADDVLDAWAAGAPVPLAADPLPFFVA